MLLIRRCTFHYPFRTTANSGNGFYSALSGLVMALKDPKTAIFAVMGCSQLLGLGFINFFPTFAFFIPCFSECTDTSSVSRGPWGSQRQLRYCSQRKYPPFVIVNCISTSLRPPWVLATIVCCVNAWHAGAVFRCTSTASLLLSVQRRPDGRALPSPVRAVVVCRACLHHRSEHVRHPSPLRFHVSDGMR